MENTQNKPYSVLLYYCYAQISNPEELFMDFYDIITSDGIVQDYEIEAFDKIKKIINQ